MEKTKVMAGFRIICDKVDPNVITKKIQINPSKCWSRGDKRGRSSKADFGLWYIETEYEESYDVNEQLAKILKLLVNKKNILQELRKSYDLEFAFDIVIHIENGEKPGIGFEPDVMKFASDIQASLEIDLYIFS